MSKMPNERSSEWNRLFDRFGRLDGGFRIGHAAETTKPGLEAASENRSGHSGGNSKPPVEKGPRRVK